MFLLPPFLKDLISNLHKTCKYVLNDHHLFTIGWLNVKYFCDGFCILANAPNFSQNINNFYPLPNYQDNCWILLEFQNFSGIYSSSIIGCPQTPCKIFSGIRCSCSTWMVKKNVFRKERSLIKYWSNTLYNMKCCTKAYTMYIQSLRNIGLYVSDTLFHF